MKIRVEEAIAANTIADLVKWSEPLEVKESEIAEGKKFIKDLKPNQVAIANTNDKGISLVQLQSLTPGRLLTLEERENEITGLLRNQKAEKAFKDYKAQLLKTAVIKRFDY